jgi:hypothetical protein
VLRIFHSKQNKFNLLKVRNGVLTFLVLLYTNYLAKCLANDDHHTTWNVDTKTFILPWGNKSWNRFINVHEVSEKQVTEAGYELTLAT